LTQRTSFYEWSVKSEGCPLRHVFYKTLALGTATALFGDNAFSEMVDFFNPISDVKDVIDMIGDMTGGDDDNASCDP
jgi:hypothetical protein